MNDKYKSCNLIPVKVIYLATKGDIVSIEIIIKNYEPYISKLCTKTVFDSKGNTYKCVDEEKKNLIELKLISKILDFKIA